MPSALPVYSVDTLEEAKILQVRLCKLSYDGKTYMIKLPEDPIEAVDSLPALSDFFNGAYCYMKGKRP